MKKLLISGATNLTLQNGVITSDKEFCYKETDNSIEISSPNNSISISSSDNVVSINSNIVIGDSGVIINGKKIETQEGECPGKKATNIEVGTNLKTIIASGAARLNIKDQLPNLKKVKLSGASKVEILKTNTVFEQGTLDITTSGSSFFVMKDFKAKDINVSTRGASRVELTRFAAEDLDLNSAGASSIEIDGSTHSIEKHSKGASIIRT